MKAARPARSPETVKTYTSMSAGTFNTLGMVFVAAVLMGLRALSTRPGTIDRSLYLLRVALPALPALGSVVLAVMLLLSGREKHLSSDSNRSRRIAAGTYLFTFSMCALDVLAGVTPYLLVPGLVVYGFVIWSRPGFLVLSALACAAAIFQLAVLSGEAVTIEFASVLVFGVMLSVFGANIVRNSVLPSEERLKNLEAENEELWNLSYKDTLTGLYNRRYIQQVATHLFSRAIRYKEPLHVLMLDIDHFKKVNDKLGHAVGDEVLKVVAQTIQGAIRTSDTVSRYGGEEFIVYMVKSNPEITQFIANRIRDSVAAIRFPGVPWSVTISIGVAGLQDGDSMEGLVERADQFLYMSKHHGRNRVSGF